MANIRQLKKKIDTQVYEVLSDCFTWKELNPGKKPEVVDEIISDAVSLRNELITRVNSPVTESDVKQNRAHFRAISADLVSGVDSLFGRLSSVSSKKKK